MIDINALNPETLQLNHNKSMSTNWPEKKGFVHLIKVSFAANPPATHCLNTQ